MAQQHFPPLPLCGNRQSQSLHRPLNTVPPSPATPYSISMDCQTKENKMSHRQTWADQTLSEVFCLLPMCTCSSLIGRTKHEKCKFWNFWPTVLGVQGFACRGSLEIGDILSDLAATPMEMIGMLGTGGLVHEGMMMAAT